jgi:hypothetical protein
VKNWPAAVRKDSTLDPRSATGIWGGGRLERTV